MLERVNPVLRMVCLGLAALLLYQLSRMAVWKSPLADVAIPSVASAAAEVTATNAGVANRTPTRPGPDPNSTLTNLATTNLATTNLSATNPAVIPAAGTNLASSDRAMTNRASSKMATNQYATRRQTSTVAAVSGPRSGRGMDASARPGSGSPPKPLPPAIQKRVDRVVQSEILGPVQHPLPMALFGIGGKDVFLRAPNGQTGLLREGEELGGVKLLKIAANRILIEQDGQKKELMIHEGIGSESLLPK